jgi:hypothetical protein
MLAQGFSPGDQHTACYALVEKDSRPNAHFTLWLSFTVTLLL